MPHVPTRLRRAIIVPVIAGLAALTAVAPSFAEPPSAHQSGGDAQHAPLLPGDVLVATSTYRNDSNIVAGQTKLPPGCSTAANAYDPCSTAVENGDYPDVFNNSVVDGSFGVTSPIVLKELTPQGHEISAITVPNSTEPGITSTSDQMVTSFSSKSELALNLSPDGKTVTFMGYNAPVDQADVSNANTPGEVDPTAADPGPYYRVAAQLGQEGQFRFTETNAYTGDNGRAAITANVNGSELIYAAGNAGNGANPEPSQVVLGSGAQLIQPANAPESAQTPGAPTPIGSFNVDSQLGFATSLADKVAKDDNFRGITIAHNVVYFSKGSGSNGVNTVYFIDTTGTACPTGVGLPVSGASLPTAANALTYDATLSPPYTKKKVVYQNPGLTPENMCILKGFPTAPAASATDASDYPFGMWFANADTLYIADEGSGTNTNVGYSATSDGTYSVAAASTTAGLQKWVFDLTTQSWNLAYTLQSGLSLGQPYTVPGYPTGLNNDAYGSGLPWAPATDGLRALTGRVNRNGTVSIWATTSTVSGSGDQGADPNALVAITDQLDATTLPASESFRTVIAPSNATVVRGVSLTPGTGACQLGHGRGYGQQCSPERRGGVYEGQ